MNMESIPSKHHGIPVASAHSAGCLQDISYDINYSNTPELALEATPTVLAKGEEATVPFTFKPAALGTVRHRISIEINGLYTMHLEVLAQVVPRAVEVTDPTHKTFALGSIKSGSVRTYTVSFTNRALLPVQLDFAQCAAALAALNVSIEPAVLDLKAREAGTVVLRFVPESRLRAFTAAVTAAVSGVQQTLMSITGAALGTEVKLGTDTLPFGTVVLGSSTTKRLQLANTGV